MINSSLRFCRNAAVSVACASLLSLGMTGCGGNNGSEKPAQETTTSSSTSAATPWKVHDTPPGADPAVSAEMGGAGFEDVAEGMGFKTYTVKPDELQFFGNPRAKKGGEINFYAQRFLLSFRPFGYGKGTTFAENQYISQLCYESLITQHPATLEIIPSLATHWKMSDDKLTFTFRINPNARFSNGLPVTAQDVVATWNLIMDPSILAPSLQLTYGKFEEPVAKSKYIVEVKCKELNWRNFIYFGGLTILNADEIGDLTGEEFRQKYVYSMPSGSGSYIILNENVVNQQSYAFTRRTDYWAKDQETSKYSGNFDQINFIVVKDNAALAYEKFKKGEFDMYYYSATMTDKWLNDTEYDAIAKGWIQKRRVFTDGPVGAAGYAFNMRGWPFDDIRIRQAFAYLHNRSALLEKLTSNQYTHIDSYYSNTEFESPSVPKVRYNPEKARKLLEEAGWKERNADGILVKDGKPFAFEFGIPKVLEKFITPYQQELKKAGIDMQLKLQDGNSLWNNMMERSFKIAWVNWGGLVTPNPQTSLSSDLADKNNNNNVEGFKNDRVDELIAQYDTTFDRATQVTIIREIDSIVTHTYKNALGWTPIGSKICHWDRFGMPEWYYHRTATFTDNAEAAMAYWWYDEAKAKALDDARNNGTALENAGKEIEVRYWKDVFPTVRKQIFAEAATE